jgi:hypothetical protein
MKSAQLPSLASHSQSAVATTRGPVGSDAGRRSMLPEQIYNGLERAAGRGIGVP